MEEYKEKLHSESQTKLETIAEGVCLSEESQQKAKSHVETVITDEDISLIGRGISAIVPASVLLACRQTGEVRTASELAPYTPEDITRERILQTSKFLATELNFGVVIANPRDFVERIGAQLDAKQKNVTLSVDIIDKMERHDLLINKAPNTVAAAVFYYVSVYGQETSKHTQQEIGEVANVSSQTIRDNYETLIDQLPDEVFTTFPLTKPSQN